MMIAVMGMRLGGLGRRCFECLKMGEGGIGVRDGVTTKGWGVWVVA